MAETIIGTTERTNNSGIIHRAWSKSTSLLSNESETTHATAMAGATHTTAVAAGASDPMYGSKFLFGSKPALLLEA